MNKKLRTVLGLLRDMSLNVQSLTGEKGVLALNEATREKIRAHAAKAVTTIDEIVANSERRRVKYFVVYWDLGGPEAILEDNGSGDAIRLYNTRKEAFADARQDYAANQHGFSVYPWRVRDGS